MSVIFIETTGMVEDFKLVGKHAYEFKPPRSGRTKSHFHTRKPRQGNLLKGLHFTKAPTISSLNSLIQAEAKEQFTLFSIKLLVDSCASTNLLPYSQFPVNLRPNSSRISLTAHGNCYGQCRISSKINKLPECFTNYMDI